MIVVVEDNRGDVELIHEALKEHNIEVPVLVVPDGAQACHLLDEVDLRDDPCPALFILDLNLPRKSGLEVLERIRRGRCAKVPVIVLSSSSAEWDRSESVRIGANRFLSKPSSLDEFLSLGAVFKGYLRG